MTISLLSGETMEKPLSDLFRRCDRGMRAIMKCIGETESPWNNPLWIGTLPRFLPDKWRLTVHWVKEEAKKETMDG